MQKQSISEIENAFFNHAADAGVIFTKRPLIIDGELHRGHVEGDKKGTKNGAYIIHCDGSPAGWFHHYGSAITGKWSAGGRRQSMTDVMRKQIEAERQRRQLEQQNRYNYAAEKASAIWTAAKPITDPSQHPYLIKKRVHSHTARLYENALTIPIYNKNKQLVNLQFINADGVKRFLAGGKKKACFSVIGTPELKKPLLICEGWATGASLHEFTGHFVVVALDAGNLEPVAMMMRRLYPSIQIIIAGDNDESEVGQRAARAAALGVGGRYILPLTIGHDWNDSLTAELTQ
jgi:putative DNA primase/helicase